MNIPPAMIAAAALVGTPLLRRPRPFLRLSLARDLARATLPWFVRRAARITARESEARLRQSLADAADGMIDPVPGEIASSHARGVALLLAAENYLRDSGPVLGSAVENATLRRLYDGLLSAQQDVNLIRWVLPDDANAGARAALSGCADLLTTLLWAAVDLRWDLGESADEFEPDPADPDCECGEDDLPSPELAS